MAATKELKEGNNLIELKIKRVNVLIFLSSELLEK
jgi:hypothetical protein